MKSRCILFVVSLFIFVACSKDDTDLEMKQLQKEKAWVKIVSELPATRSVVTAETPVKLTVSYYIPNHIQEGKGFRLVFWSKMDNSRIACGNSWYHLKTRKNMIETERILSEWSHYPVPKDSVIFHVSLVRVEDDTDSDDLAISNEVTYFMNSPQ